MTDATASYFRLNVKIAGTPSTDERYLDRKDAAEAFRRAVASPELSFVEVWDCDPASNSAQKLWEFEPDQSLIS